MLGKSKWDSVRATAEGGETEATLETRIEMTKNLHISGKFVG